MLCKDLKKTSDRDCICCAGVVGADVVPVELAAAEVPAAAAAEAASCLGNVSSQVLG